MADGEFDVVLAIIPEGQDEAASKTNTLTEAVKAGGEASKGAAAANEKLSASDFRRAEALAATVQAMQQQMAAASEVQRQQIALANLVQQATGATATEMARANQVAANIAGLQERTAIMRAQLEVALQGPAAERAWAEAEALRARVAATGAAPGSPGAAAAEAELVAQERLAQELAAITASRERDTAAASAEAAAQRQLATSLASLQSATTQTAERTAAERQGVAAVAAYNLQLAQRNALLAAGVAEVGAQGQLVVIEEEGAAAIRAQVAALQAEEGALAAVKAEMAEAAAPGVLSRALDEVLQALKYIVIYGALIKLGEYLADAVKEAVALESSLTRLRTLVGLNAAEVEGFRAAIHGIALETGQSSDENAKALFAVTSSGLRGEQALLALKASAEGAAIGLGDQTTVARAATSAMIAYGAGNLSAKAALDVIIATAREGNVSVDQLAGSFGRVIPIAATVGVNFAQVGAAVASMTRLGLSADEAVTALRGTLTALTLKEAKGADAALKSVGFSLAGLKQEIHDKGLAQALVDLVQKFGGNEEAIAKIIPNVRALTEVLGNAKSQAGEYVAIQDRVNASIGHATDDAFKLVQADPAFVFKQTKTAVAELALSLVEGLLPQLVAVSQRIKEAATSGDFSGLAAAISGGFRVIVVAGEAASVVLSNLPIVIAAVTIAMIANGSAATIWGDVIAWLSLRLEVLWATIAANPIGALAVVLGIGLIALNKWVDATRAADQAFLDQVGTANRNKVALAELGKEYDVLAQKQGRVLSGPAAQVAGANKNNQVVLSADAGTFLGEMNRVNATYAEQIEKAGKDKVAIEAAKLARDRDVSALQSHTQALLDNAKAAVTNEEAQTADMQRLVQVAKDRLDAAAQSAITITHSPDKKYAETYGPQAFEALDKAKDAYGRLSGALQTHTAILATSKAAIDLEQQALDRSRAVRDTSTASVVKASRAAENARFEIEKGIAARELEARSAAVLASAELLGAEAVRQATIVAQADKLIQADRERAKKAGIEVTALEEQRIRSSTAALSDQNQIARLNQQIFASGEANHATAVANEGKFADALAGTSTASQLAAAQLQVEAAARKNGNSILDDSVQRLVAEAQARIISTAQTDLAVAAVKREIAASEEQRKAAADLADAQGRTKANSQALLDELKVETIVRSLGTVATQAQRDAEAARAIGLQAEAAGTEKQTQAQEQLNAAELVYRTARASAEDDRAKVALVAQYDQAVADLAIKLGAGTEATRKLAIEEAVEAQILASKVPLTAEDIAGIRQRIAAQQEALQQLKDGNAIAAASADVWRPLQDGFTQAIGVGVQALNTWLEGGKVTGEEIAKSLLDILLKTFEQILQNWIELQLAMKAASAINDGSSYGGGGGGGGGAGSYLGTAASLYKAGAGYFGGAAAGGAAAGGATAVTATYASADAALAAPAANAAAASSGYAATAGWAVVAVVAVLAILNIYASHKSTWASIDVGYNQGKLVASTAKGAEDRAALLAPLINGLVTSANNTVASLGGAITDIVGRLTIKRDGRSSNTDYSVIFEQAGQQFTADFGKNVQGALEFGAIRAIQQAKTVGLDPIISRAIQGSVAQTFKDFQADLALATKVDNLGKTDLQVQIQQQAQSFTDMRVAIAALLGPSDALTEAWGKIAVAQRKFWEDAKSQILGIQAAPSQKLGQSVLDYNAAADAQRRSATVQYNAAVSQLAAAKAQLDAARIALQATAGLSQLNKDPALRQAFVDAVAAFDAAKATADSLKATLDSIPAAITPAEEAQGLARGNQNSPQFFALQLGDATKAASDLIGELSRAGYSAANFAASVANVNASLVASLESQRDVITGRQRTAAEDIASRRAQAVLWNAELEIRKASVAAQIIDIQAKLIGAGVQIEYTRVMVQSGGYIAKTVIEVAGVVGAAGGFTAAQLDAMKQQLQGLVDLEKALQGIKPIDPSEIRGTSGSGGTSPAQQLKDIFAAFAKSQLPQLAQQIADVNSKWDAALKLAGHNSAAIAQVNKDRTIEIALLEKQAREAAVKGATDFIGGPALVTQIAGVHTSAQGLVDALRSLNQQGALSTQQLHQLVPAIRAAEAAQVAAIKGGVFKSIDDFAATLSSQGLGGQLRSIADQGNALRDSLNALAAAGTLTADEFFKAAGKIIDATRAQQQASFDSAANSLLSDLYGYLHDDAAAAKLKYDLTVAELQVREKELEVAVAMYQLNGALIPEIQALIAKVIAGGPALFASGGNAGNQQSYADAVAADKARFNADRDNALAGLAQYELAQQSQIAQQIAKINADFASYRAVLGDTAQVQRDYALALRSVILGALQPLQTFLDGLNTSQFSPLRALDQLAASQQTFERALAAVQGGDFTHISDLTGYAQAYLQQALSSLPVGSDEYKRIEARVEAEIKAILAQYGGTNQPPGGGPGAPPPPGPTPPPPPVNVQPVVDVVASTAADQLVELKEITRNTRETKTEVYALRRRLDDPLTVFERVS